MEINEIDVAIESGIEAFKEFILQKQNALKDYLERFFWVINGSQMTILNYLIKEHQTPKVDGNKPRELLDYINFLVATAKDRNAGEPIHQAIALGKFDLAIHLLEQNNFNINLRNHEGRTLLSVVIATKHQSLLKTILQLKPNVHAVSPLKNKNFLVQPLHEAILSDFAIGVETLGQAGAQLGNPIGPLMDTPVLLAAREKKINALTSLLKFPSEQLTLNRENNDPSEVDGLKDTAIDLLCYHLTYDKNNKSLVRGIAMLICCGAEPPRRQDMLQLLANKRSELLKEIDLYLEKYPKRVEPFVKRCHVVGSSLHSIIYVDHSWGNTLRQLLGRPSAAGFIVEGWVTRKNNSPRAKRIEGELESKEAVTFSGEEDSSLLYAEFVRRYDEAYSKQKIPNPWSTMRWMIAEGKSTWAKVLDYTRSHPNTRTSLIVKNMIKADSEALSKSEHVSLNLKNN